MARVARPIANANFPTPPTTQAIAPRPATASTAGSGAAAAAAAAAGPSGAALSSSAPAAAPAAASPSPATPVAGPSRPTRTSARSRRSTGGRAGSATASPAASGPSDPTAGAPSPQPSAGGGPARPVNVAPKVHGLRNSLSTRERQPCPFPTEYGGVQHLGVHDEDASDEVLMAVCGACAIMGNVALSPDEIASIAFDHGWLRPPSVAVAPSTMISNAIRMHQSRCSKAKPARKPLITKYQLSGAMAEQVLEPALHPSAFEGAARPKGPVWYLSPDVGRAKWRNPFAGIVIPKAPPRKPGAPRPKSIKPKKEEKSAASAKKKEATPAPADSATTAGPSAVPRIKLRVSTSAPTTESSLAPEDSSDIVSSSRASSVSRTAESISTVPTTPCTSTTPRTHRRRKPRASVFDSSSEESDSSDDDDDDAPPAQSESARKTARRIVLPPSAMGAGARFHARTAHSPLGELFFSPISSQQPLPHVSASPFPSHCLDNTTWVARRSAEDEAFNTAFETSSSSEDEEMRNADWGTGLGFMVKADEEDLTASWTSESDAKLSEATDAMSQLFRYKEQVGGQEPVFNQLDNRPDPSDASSLAESSTTATANAVYQGKLKSAACPNALPAWALSSPVSSPSMAGRTLPIIEASPTHYHSRPAREFEARPIEMHMDVDMADGDESWLDESGQLPVHAEDTFSDVEVGSALGETTPERERQLQTAEWARETAQSALHIKHEPEDYYPSPAATASTEDDSGILSAESRESTVSTASSPLSELPELDSDTNDTVEILLGPESINIDELDDWLPQKEHRTPHRGRGRHTRHDRCDSTRSSGSWGGIGVNNPFVPVPALTASCKVTPPPLVRKRSLRTGSRRNRSALRGAERSRERLTPAPGHTDVIVVDIAPSADPPVEEVELDVEVEVEAEAEAEVEADADTEDDGIGTAELELAYAEAEAREEQVRAQKRAAAEESKRRWEACRRAFADAAAAETSSNVSPNETPAPSSSCSEAQPTWSELHTTWGSTDSVSDMGGTLPMTLVPLALQMPPGISPADSAAILQSLDPKALHASPAQQDVMMLDSVLSQAEIDAMAAQLLPPAVAAAPTLAPAAPASAPPSLPTLAPAPPHPPTGPSPKKLAPKRAQPIAPAPVPIAPAPVAIAPAPERKPSGEHVEKVLAPKPPLKAASLPATPIAAKMTPPGAPSAAAQQAARAPGPIVTSGAQPGAPTRTVSPLARTSTTSPTGSTTPSDASGPSTTSSAPSTTSTGQSTPSSARSGTPASGGTTKRLLPGIDACVVDNLPCYSHVWDNPSGGRCTVLRRLDTDFVNGTALLTALGVPPTCHAEHLNAPVPTLASHRTVPLVSPQGLHHAPGVPGVWIPLVEARELARKLALKETTLLANLLREDLFQLFKELAGLSLRHTSSTESFGMPFVTQPHARKPAPRPPAPQVGKPPLVRPPTAQPEGCPQPKRRRATVAAATTSREQAMQGVAAGGPGAGSSAPGPSSAPGQAQAQAHAQAQAAHAQVHGQAQVQAQNNGSPAMGGRAPAPLRGPIPAPAPGTQAQAQTQASSQASSQAQAQARMRAQTQAQAQARMQQTQPRPQVQTQPHVQDQQARTQPPSQAAPAQHQARLQPQQQQATPQRTQPQAHVQPARPAHPQPQAQAKPTAAHAHPIAPRKPMPALKPALQPAPAPPVTRAKAAPIAPRRSARASIGAK